MTASDSSPVIEAFEELVKDAPRHNIHDLNQLGEELKVRLYSLLIPDKVFEVLGMDREKPVDLEGERVVSLDAPSKSNFAVIEVRENPGDRDCVFFLEIEDTAFYKIDINFLIINDPRGPRFNTDIDETGRRTKFATVRRNIPE